MSHGRPDKSRWSVKRLVIPKESQSSSDQAGILVIGRILASLSEALVLLVIARLLGKAELGSLAALFLTYETIALLASAGFPAALMYFLPAQDASTRRSIVARFIKVSIAMGTAAATLLVGIGAIDYFHPDVFDQVFGSHSPANSEETRVSLQYLALLGFSAILDVPSRLMPNLLVIEGRAKSAAAVGILRSLGRTLFPVVPIALGASLWWVAGALSVFGLVFGTLIFWFHFDLYRNDTPSPWNISNRELFRFAIPLGLTEAVGILNKRLDRFLVVGLFAATVVAEYEVGAWQIPFVATIPFSVGAAYTPRFRELFAQGKARAAIELWKLSSIKVGLIVMPVCAVFVIAAEESIALLFTEQYSAATTVFRLYTFWTLLRIAAFGNVITAAGKPQFVLQAAAVSFVTNIAISVPLTLWLGFEGAAWGTLLSFIPIIGFYCWKISDASGVPLRSIYPVTDILRIFGVLALPCYAAWVAKSHTTVDGPLTGIMVSATIILVGYSLIGTLTKTISSEDWRYLKNWATLKILR